MSKLEKKPIENSRNASDEILDIIIEVSCFNHDCYIKYKVSQFEIDNGHIPEIIRGLQFRIQDFIQEKLNETSAENEIRKIQKSH